MRSFRSPAIVGRGEELELLLEACRSGAPSTVVLVGRAGMGKSRLVQALCEQAALWGLRTAVGRAAPSTDVPFRALAEAVRDGARSSGGPQGHAHDVVAVGRQAHAVDVGDAVLSLLSPRHGERPVVCVLEDLHWADEETLDAVEYLADSSASRDFRMVLTGRPEESAAFDELVDRLTHRAAATTVALAPLDDDDVARLITAALPAGSTLPRDVQALVVRSAAGTPLYVEDLLAALLTDGADAAPEPRADITGGGADVVVPVSFVDSVARRLRRLDPPHRQAVDAAALLASVDEDLLAEVCGLPASDVAAALWAAADQQLFAVTSHGLDFRHALTRSAITALLPEMRRERLAGAGLRVLTRRFPTWPGTWAQRAAELARTAGDLELSAQLSLVWARRLVDRGLLSAARDHLERELPLQAAGASADRLRLMLVEVLATAGDHPAAVAAGDAVAPSLEGERLVELHLALARSAVQATDWGSARSHLEAATTSPALLRAGPGADLTPLAVLAVTRADVALGTFDPRAEALAREAVRAADRCGTPSLQGDALDTLGRALRRHDLDAAEAIFDRAARLAARGGDVYRRARAVHQMGTITLLRDVEEGRLAEAQSLAEGCGAAQLAAHATYHRAVVAFLIHDVARADDLLNLAESQAARYRLRSLHAAVLATQAAMAAAVGDADRAGPLIARAVRIAGDDAEAAARARGQGNGMLALAREDRAGAREALREAMDVAHRTPGTSPAPYKGLWALTEVAAGTDAASVRAELVTTGALLSRVNRGCLGWVDAIAAGRAGHVRRARELSDEANSLLARTPWFQQMARRIAADLAGPWGETGQWLREVAAWFDEAGNQVVADAARAALRRSGQAVPRRRADGVDVPPAWAGLGVTRREAEVLGAVAEGVDNAEIGRRLFISPRTVEKHVENLQLKTGLASRSQLIAFALRRDLPERAQPPR